MPPLLCRLLGAKPLVAAILTLLASLFLSISVLVFERKNPLLTEWYYFDLSSPEPSIVSRKHKVGHRNCRLRTVLSFLIPV